MNVVLFGAGNTGREVLAMLRSIGIEPVAFLDETPQKIGTIIDSIPVKSPEEFASEATNKPLVIVCLAKTFTNTSLKIRKLNKIGFVAISFLQLPHIFPHLTTRFQTSIPRLLTSLDDINRLNALVFDDRSRKVLNEQIQFRLTLDGSVITSLDKLIYFPSPQDVPLDIQDQAYFLDAGAYDGDTLFMASGLLPQCIKAYAFEPDEANFSKLKLVVDKVGFECEAIQAAISDEDGVMAFSSSGDMSSSLDQNGTTTVVAMSLPRVLESNFTGHPCYLKFDIEGSEASAIKSALPWIARNKPKMAISIYHHPSDLWQIPLMIADLNVGYNIALRCYGYEGNEVVCYCF